MSKRPEGRKQAIELLERTAAQGSPLLEPARDFIPYPQVVETTHRGGRSWGSFSRLLKDRLDFLRTEEKHDVRNIICAQLRFLVRQLRGPSRGRRCSSPRAAGAAIYGPDLRRRAPPGSRATAGGAEGPRGVTRPAGDKKAHLQGNVPPAVSLR